MYLNSTVVIKRISAASEINGNQFNALRDEGTEWDAEQGKKYLASEDNALFLAFIEEEIVGFLTAHRLQRLDKRKAEILLYEVSVAPDFRQKGIGKALIDGVKKWGKEVEADEVWVLTERSNLPAMALYQSMGGTRENSDEQMFTFKI